MTGLESGACYFEDSTLLTLPFLFVPGWRLNISSAALSTFSIIVSRETLIQLCLLPVALSAASMSVACMTVLVLSTSSQRLLPMQSYIFDNYCVMSTNNLNVPIMIRVCVPAFGGFARCLHTCDPMFMGVLIFIRIYASYEYTHTMFIYKMLNFVCTSPSHMCVLQQHLYPYLFHQLNQW